MPLLYVEIRERPGETVSERIGQQTAGDHFGLFGRERAGSRTCPSLDEDSAILLADPVDHLRTGLDLQGI
jgi:hypothetical protein